MEVVNKEALIVKHTIVKMEQVDYLFEVECVGVFNFTNLKLWRSIQKLIRISIGADFKLDAL